MFPRVKAGETCEHCGQRMPSLDEIASSPSQPANIALDALRDVLAMIDEGYLVRDISNDGEPGFALRQLPYVIRLQKAARAAAPALGDPKKDE